jgi:hypothetical protein
MRVPTELSELDRVIGTVSKNARDIVALAAEWSMATYKERKRRRSKRG